MSELFGRSETRTGDLSAEDARRLTENLGELIEQAKGVSWYGDAAGEADLALARLCLLRRARAGERGATQAGDEAVRELAEQATPEAVAWLLTRAVSYMDEQSFPDFVAGARLEA